jgi:hypothetical protein
MSRVLSWILGLLGLIGLVTFFSFEVQRGQGHFSFRMGQPDAWFFWEEGPNGFQQEMNFIRWSFGIGVLALICLRYSLRFARGSKPNNKIP